MLNHDNIRIKRLQSDVNQLNGGLLNLTRAINSMQRDLTTGNKNMKDDIKNEMEKIRMEMKMDTQSLLRAMKEEIKRVSDWPFCMISTINISETYLFINHKQ